MKRRERVSPCMRIVRLFDQRFAVEPPREWERHRNVFINFGLLVWASAKQEGKRRGRRK